MPPKMLQIFFFIITIFSLSITAQEKGTFYSNSQALEHYGKVDYSNNLHSKLLIELSNKSENLMFGFDDGYLIITDSDRNILYTNKPQVAEVHFAQAMPHFVLTVFSSSKVKELIYMGKSSTTTVEMRNGIITVTSGLTTMQGGSFCPPCCPDCSNINMQYINDSIKIFRFSNLI